MANLGWGWGFELQSTSSGVEINSVSGTHAINTTIKRSGDAAGSTTLASGTRAAWDQQFLAANGNGPYYFQAAHYFDALPSGTTSFMSWSNSGGSTLIRASITSAGTISLIDEDGTIGTSTFACSADTWYVFEVLIDLTGAGATDIITLRIEDETGTTIHETITSSTRNISSGIFSFNNGANLIAEAVTGGPFICDDIIIHDSSGSTANSWVGGARLVIGHANGAGSNAMGTRGGADTGSDWGQVADDPTPDNATDYYILDANNDILDVEVEDAATVGIDSYDTIVTVMCGLRIRQAASATATTFNARIGNIDSATTVSISSGVTWHTHDDTQPKTYTYSAHTDPNTSSAWTTSGYDGTEFGVKVVDADPDLWVTKIWAQVEYIDGSPPAGGVNKIIQMGIIPV